MTKRIDLNCDMGEGFEVDSLIMPYITSANIACCGHAGTEDLMNETVQLAKKNDVAIGAHPAFPDKEDFGRRMMDLSPVEIYNEVIDQIDCLKKVCDLHDVSMNHVKPHGALYNLAARDREVADAIAKAVYEINPHLILFGLSGSKLIEAGLDIGLKVASEVFSDRTYQPDGSLTLRTEREALIEDAFEAIEQVEQMILEGHVKSTNGNKVKINADTICIHGDGVHAVDFAKQLNDALEQKGIKIVAVGN